MGSDIHVIVEKYNKEKNIWEALEDEEDTELVYKLGSRDYLLFAKLAGVRNYGDFIPLSNPRGVPSDASKAWKKLLKEWGPDIHSESYYLFQELEYTKGYSNRWDKALDDLEQRYPNDILRLMFGFDN
jgi:hypothetical protein